ncbi:MAG: DNA-binding NtrC family response regulator [Halioglobus sp.]|jgi:two-component system nitrogen regulation response regulator GlnG
MSKRATADITLPSLVAYSPRVAPRHAIVLTIIFHPETDRIGETACFAKVTGEKSWLLGRRAPQFLPSTTHGAARGLDDSYISRTALKLRFSKGDLILERVASSSRCSVLGTDIGTEVSITKAQLQLGVPIQLGGRVVLLLREGSVVEANSGPAGGLGLIGGSDYMRQLRAQVIRLATTDLDVLIRGETGTGKELVAAAIHDASERSHNALVAVNMAAIPEALASAALFGNARGAFTGADKATQGYFEQADGSTIFLDEIGDTPQDIQPLLLRALQQREIQCVGGAIKAVDTRVISATDVQLSDDQCGFKAALRYRLAESELELAPLRDHPEDIGELLWTFVSKELLAMGREHLLPKNLCTAANTALWAEFFHASLCYQWPGNVRQLINYARQVAVASETRLHIPDTIRKALHGSRDELGGQVDEQIEPRFYTDCEFRESYAIARYEVTRVARELGLSRQAVYRRISEMSDLCLANEVPSEKIWAALRDTSGDQALAAMQLKVSLAGLRERIRNTPQTGML